MVTKTLTIMEDVYDLLVQSKRESESFSDELRRILTRKSDDNPWMELFGILKEKEEGSMMKNLMKAREQNLKHLKKEFKLK
jgi:predicted CopG family antitoxin